MRDRILVLSTFLMAIIILSYNMPQGKFDTDWFIVTVIAIIAIGFLYNWIVRRERKISRMESDIEELKMQVDNHRIGNTAENILDKYYPKERTEFREKILEAMEEYQRTGRPNW